MSWAHKLKLTKVQVQRTVVFYRLRPKAERKIEWYYVNLAKKQMLLKWRKKPTWQLAPSSTSSFLIIQEGLKDWKKLTEVPVLLLDVLWLCSGLWERRRLVAFGVQRSCLLAMATYSFIDLTPVEWGSGPICCIDGVGFGNWLGFVMFVKILVDSEVIRF